jgi:hypothetical protein
VGAQLEIVSSAAAPPRAHANYPLLSHFSSPRRARAHFSPNRLWTFLGHFARRPHDPLRPCTLMPARSAPCLHTDINYFHCWAELLATFIGFVLLFIQTRAYRNEQFIFSSRHTNGVWFFNRTTTRVICIDECVIKNVFVLRNCPVEIVRQQLYFLF